MLRTFESARTVFNLSSVSPELSFSQPSLLLLPPLNVICTIISTTSCGVGKKTCGFHPPLRRSESSSPRIVVGVQQERFEIEGPVELFVGSLFECGQGAGDCKTTGKPVHKLIERRPCVVPAVYESRHFSSIFLPGAKSWPQTRCGVSVLRGCGPLRPSEGSDPIVRGGKDAGQQVGHSRASRDIARGIPDRQVEEGGRVQERMC